MHTFRIINLWFSVIMKMWTLLRRITILTRKSNLQIIRNCVNIETISSFIKTITKATHSTSLQNNNNYLIPKKNTWHAYLILTPVTSIKYIQLLSRFLRNSFNSSKNFKSSSSLRFQQIKYYLDKKEKPYSYIQCMCMLCITTVDNISLDLYLIKFQSNEKVFLQYRVHDAKKDESLSKFFEM